MLASALALLFGLGLVIFGIAWLSWPAAVIVGGLLLIGTGLTYDHPQANR